METWRAVPSFEGLYEVSNLGQVRSVDRVIECAGPRGVYASRKLGRVLRPGRMTSGHMSVVLGRRAGSFCVHALVLLAFVGPCPAAHEVRHKNGDPADNRLSNLEYATRARNGQDKKHHKGARNYILRPHQIARIKASFGSRSGVALAREHRVAPSTISAIKTGRFHVDIDPAL